MSVIVQNITKQYGQQLAVNRINFELKVGEITGFIGPNGSGKSTTMKIICGLIMPDSGEILFDGKKHSDLGLELKRKIGYLPENNPLYYDQYISEYLYYVGKMYSIKRLSARIKEIMHITGLELERNKKIGQLSKGYKQRVGLAQALIHDPEILILDEPTTGLDPNQLVEIRELINKNAEQKTVLLSTHILQEVEAICQRVVMINKGEIVANDTTRKLSGIVENQQRTLVQFKEQVTHEKLSAVVPGAIVEKQDDKNWVVCATVNADLRELIFQFANENKLTLLELSSDKRSLEDTFRSLSAKK